MYLHQLKAPAHIQSHRAHRGNTKLGVAWPTLEGFRNSVGCYSVSLFFFFLRLGVTLFSVNSRSWNQKPRTTTALRTCMVRKFMIVRIPAAHEASPSVAAQTFAA